MKPILFEPKYAKIIAYAFMSGVIVAAISILVITLWVVKSFQADIEYKNRLNGEIGKPVQIINEYKTK